MSAPPAPRRAVPADVPALAALYAECARALGPQVYTPEQVAAWASFGADTPAFRAYVLEADTWVIDAPDGPAGFCGVAAGGEIRSLYVRAAATRRGLGTGLLAHAMGQARAGGVERFSAWATPFSRAVFERAGLRLVQVVRGPFQGVLFDRYRMAGG